MISQDVSFQFFSFFDAIESGLYFVIVGYYFLIFAYFILMRFRSSKRIYWLFFSVLFLFLAASRVFLIAYYFYIPELITTLDDEIVVFYLMLTFRMSTFFTWMATACLMGVLGILLFPTNTEIAKEKGKPFNLMDWFKNRNNLMYLLKAALIAIPVIIGILALSIPDEVFMDPDLPNQYNYIIDLVTITIGTWSYPVGRFILTLVLLPLFVVIIPFIYIYLAFKTFGVLRRSYALNAIGFFLYFLGRIMQGVLDALNLPHVRAIAPPLIILLSLLIIVIANSYETLK